MLVGEMAPTKPLLTPSRAFIRLRTVGVDVGVEHPTIINKSNSFFIVLF